MKQIMDAVISQFIYSQNIVLNMIDSCEIEGRGQSINIYSVPEQEVKATWVSVELLDDFLNEHILVSVEPTPVNVHYA